MIFDTPSSFFPSSFFVVLLTWTLIMRIRARSLIYYIRVRIEAWTCPIFLFLPFLPKMAQKNAKLHLLKINKLQRKCIFLAFFLQKYLVNSKKSSTFALAFEKQVCFDFLPEPRTLKSESSMKVLIFLRQSEGKSNWKIDTISVVQELFNNPIKLGPPNNF